MPARTPWCWTGRPAIMKTTALNHTVDRSGRCRSASARRAPAWLGIISVLGGIACAAPGPEEDDTVKEALTQSAVTGQRFEETSVSLTGPDDAPMMSVGGVRCTFENPAREPVVRNSGIERRVSFGQTVICSGPVRSIDIRVELYFTSVEVPRAEPDRLIGQRSDSESSPNLSSSSLDTGPVRCPATASGLGGYYGLTGSGQKPRISRS